MTDVCRQYDRIAQRFAETRSRELMEEAYLERIVAGIPAGGTVLDLGCGVGEPIAQFFIERGYRVTGIDGAPSMIRRCRAAYPHATWRVADMRGLSLDARFDAVIAWDSFFHLSGDDQRSMFGVFAEHLASGGLLLFTSGHEAGELVNEMHGQRIYHASLDAGEYRALLSANGMTVVLHKARDPECGLHTVWLAQRQD